VVRQQLVDGELELAERGPKAPSGATAL